MLLLSWSGVTFLPDLRSFCLTHHCIDAHSIGTLLDNSVTKSEGCSHWCEIAVMLADGPAIAA